MSYLDEHRNEIFKKYTDEELLRDIHNYVNGGGKLNKVLNHFFEECIFNCKNNNKPKTPMEALQCDEDMEFILSYIASKPKFYTGSEVANVKTWLRNSTRIARKVANFCPKTARDIYFRYHDKNGQRLNCLDTSCGFGSRMSAVLLSGHNYCGFDPNPELYAKLIEYKNWLRENDVIKPAQRCGLYKHGSEIHRPELDGLFDVSFTSPPYFNLESYGEDESASTSNYDNYDKWLSDFAKPTINNTYYYLKNGGIAMINIKNMTNHGKHPLFDDWFKLFETHGGFELLEVFEMKHQSKRNFWMNCGYTEEEFHGFKEPVMAFRKVK